MLSQNATELLLNSCTSTVHLCTVHLCTVHLCTVHLCTVHLCSSTVLRCPSYIVCTAKKTFESYANLPLKKMGVLIHPSSPLPPLAHINRVTALKYIHEPEWLLSVGRDKTFQWHCAKTGKKLGSYESAAWCLAIEYPYIDNCV